MATTKKTTTAKSAPAAKKPAAKKVTATRVKSSAESVPAPKKTAEAVVETPKVAKETKSASKLPTRAGEFFYAAGNRKTSVARVRLYDKGTGTIEVNGKKLEEYIGVPDKRDSIKAPLRITGHGKTFDITVKTSGGGLSGQADAIRHGIAKALLAFDPSLRITLKRAGFLTRDPRMKERKKYGLHRARRAPQWSKR